MKFSKIEKKRSNENYIEYMKNLIRLMRNICKDRNKKLIKVTD